jgi:type II secretory pathway pseudopilin PulG
MKGTQRRTIRKEKNNSAGFTLIEMIVTVASQFSPALW